jgi:hypothetical protein
MKDLVNSPARKYQDIFDTITNTNANAKTNYNKYLPDDNFNSDSDTTINENTYTSIHLLPTENENTNASGMKDELKMFLKKQLNTSAEPDGLSLAPSFGSSF